MIWSIKLRGLCIVGYGFNLCFLGHFVGEMEGLLNKTCVVFGNYINYRYLCCHLGLENRSGFTSLDQSTAKLRWTVSLVMPPI